MVVALFLTGTGPAVALPCADPVTYLYLCCPKPCQVNDGQNIVQNAIQSGLEGLKLTSMVSQMTGWKDQMAMIGQTLGMINGLINQLFGAKTAAFSGFSAPTLVPQGMTGNPLNIGQMAGQAANLFLRPNATQSGEIQDTQRRQNMLSAGYVESLASGVNGRTMLDKSTTEYRDLVKVVNNAADSDTGGSRDENDVNLHTDLAAMNQTRLALLQASRNELMASNVMLATDGYDALGKIGVDRQTDASKWASLDAEQIRNLTPALARFAADTRNADARIDLIAGIGGGLIKSLFAPPQGSDPIILAQAVLGSTDGNPYASASKAFDAAAATGFTNPQAQADAASSNAFLAYDNAMERAVQVHNAATAYVSMMGTIRLNQETIALQQIAAAAVAEQRRRMINGLGMFWLDPESAFNAMAVQSVGSDGMSGIDPWTYGDSVTQQAAATGALNAIGAQIATSLTPYGAPACIDVVRSTGFGYTKRVAHFLRAPTEWTPTLQALYANADQQTCGALAFRYLSSPADPIYTNTTDTTNLTSADIDQSPAVKQSVSQAALQDFVQGTATGDPNLTYWITLSKQVIWLQSFVDHAKDVIRNTQTEIATLQTNTNDPTTSLVLQALPGIGPVDLTNGDAVNGQIKALLASAATQRGQVPADYLSAEARTLRDAQLQAAAAVISNDPTYQKWASTAPASDDTACATQQCWGASDATWAAMPTVMGQPVGSKAPYAALPVVQAVPLTTQPAADGSMGYCGTLAVNTSDPSYVGCPVKPQEPFSPSAVQAAPFATGATLQP
jgi:hypothetical protein